MEPSNFLAWGKEGGKGPENYLGSLGERDAVSCTNPERFKCPLVDLYFFGKGPFDGHGDVLNGKRGTRGADGGSRRLNVPDLTSCEYGRRH